ncbi:putative transposase [Lachnospiraceae bacterium PM6-15]|uniref:RNA-guided endonuclease InsQ/TnpB family protein n=1 Tax=Ohessyouella blattaphilus TaxID=2949333 RepID=UPI003E2919EE
MYKSKQILISKRKEPELYTYLEDLGFLAKSLYNASLFRIRQNFTGRRKEVLSDNEALVAEEIRQVLSRYPHLQKPKSVLTYTFLEKLMRVTENPDFFAGLPMQSAQAVVKQAVTDFNNWLAAKKDYWNHPHKYLGEPQMPSYKKGEFCSFLFTNQDCVLYAREDCTEGANLKFPKKKGYYLLASLPLDAKLKMVQVSRCYDSYKLGIVLEFPELEVCTGERVAAIDFGINNLATIVSTGDICQVYKGGIIKSKNQWFNKERARLTSIMTKGHPVKQRVTSRRLTRLSKDRHLFIQDYFHKVSRDIVNACVRDGVGTLILGVNQGWKQEANLGKAMNQSFTQIPLGILKEMIRYKAEWAGISVYEQEESYTSKADFLSSDAMPVYSKKQMSDPLPIFSGKRIKRGLYASGSGVVLNADVNAAANIMIKAIPTSSLEIKRETLESPKVSNLRDLNCKSIPVKRIVAA